MRRKEGGSVVIDIFYELTKLFGSKSEVYDANKVVDVVEANSIFNPDTYIKFILLN